MRAFNEIQFYDFQNGRQGEIVNEIQSKGKDYILKVDEQEYINYLHDKCVLEPLTIHAESESFETPHVSIERVTNHSYERGYHEVDAYLFTMKYDYSGSDELFYVHTNPWNMTSYDITLDKRLKKVSFSFKIYKQDAEEFRRIKNQCFGNAFSNLENANNNASDFIEHSETQLQEHFKGKRKNI